MEISIVIPVYNSEENLIELNRQIKESLVSIEYELILVNDGSPDGSWDIICQLADGNSEVIGINLRKNCGQDNAIMAGLNHSRGDFIVIMDDDLQHSPSDIIELVNKCKEGYDVCYANFMKKKQAWWKNLGSWGNGKIAEILIEKPSQIYLSPFEALCRAIVDEVIKYKGPYPYVQGLILNVTRNVTQVDVQHHERYKGTGNFNLIRSIRILLKLATSFSVIPLRFATIVGLVASGCGFMLIPVYLYFYFFG